MEERRTSRRIPVTFRVSFSPVSVGTREGTIVDLAPEGCRVESPIIVPINTYLELRLEVSLKDPPILVDLAAVRWIGGGHLGVEFLSLRTEHQARLQRIIDQAQ
jgi:hypothetical protein